MISFNDISFQWEEVKPSGEKRLVIFVKNLPEIPTGSRPVVENELKSKIEEIFKDL